MDRLSMSAGDSVADVDVAVLVTAWRPGDVIQKAEQSLRIDSVWYARRSVSGGSRAYSKIDSLFMA